tara:strand:+ start:115 stop:294 length:180 start_codon:yes stop_codon:yes gene_type:complete
MQKDRNIEYGPMVDTVKIIESKRTLMSPYLKSLKILKTLRLLKIMTIPPELTPSCSIAF